MLAILECQGQADLIQKTANITRQPLQEANEEAAQEASPYLIAAATAMSMQAAMPPAAAPMAMPTLAAPNGQPYIDNFFENYGVNPFINTEDDHLSIFALYVDTGSYTVVRRTISDGNLPDKDAVRVKGVSRSTISSRTMTCRRKVRPSLSTSTAVRRLTPKATATLCCASASRVTLCHPKSARMSR